jgi:hypothetical protein
LSQLRKVARPWGTGICRLFRWTQMYTTARRWASSSR